MWQVRELVVYMSRDRSCAGDLQVGQPWPDVTLVTLEGSEVKLSEIYSDRERPLLLFGASRS